MSTNPTFAPGPRIVRDKAPSPQKTPGGPNLDKGDPRATGRREVDLAEVLYRLRATYESPIDKSRKALPPHRWFVFDPSVKPSVCYFTGPKSASTGDGTVLKSSVPQSPNPLVMMWLPFDVAARKSLLEKGEIWADLEKDEWVTIDQLKDIDQRKRKLVRLPIWRSDWKAKSGGLVDGPNDDFKKTGKLAPDAIAPYGTVQTPWDVQVDYKWFRAFVYFQYFDVVQRKHQPIPPGALGRVLMHDHGGKSGGGSMIADDGKMYILADMPLADMQKDGHGVGLVTLEDTWIDLQAKAGGTPDPRMKAGKPPASPKLAYRMPEEWSSVGMEVRSGTATAARTTYAKALGDLHEGDVPTLYVHLDDAVLADDKNYATVPKDSRVTLFDQYLKIRDPDDKRPDWSKIKLQENYLRAEDAVVDDKAKADKGFESTTRLVILDGAVYHLQGERVPRTKNTEPVEGPDHVGARLARVVPELETHVWNTYHYHLVETALDDFNYHGKKTRLTHLLVHASSFLDPNDPAAGGRKATDDEVATVAQMLSAAAARWDQNHPSLYGDSLPAPPTAPPAPKKKDYGVVPKGGVKDGTRVVFLKHFFGTHGTADANKFTIILQQKTKYGDRAYVTGNTMFLIPQKAGPDTSTTAQDAGDNVSEPWFTLSHEFGHVISYPDEYAENIDLSSLNPDPVQSNMEPRLPVFKVGEKPFSPDYHAMMQHNQLPRLRYLWNHIQWGLAQFATVKGEGPWVAEHRSFAEGLVHETPGGNKAGPWDVLGAMTALPSGKARMTVFGVGDDEGTVGALLTKPGQSFLAKADRIDGIAVVRSKFWFDFTNFSDNAGRWSVMYKFQQRLQEDTAHRRYVAVSSNAAAKLKRVLVYFQPQFEFGPSPYQGSTSADADVRLYVTDEGILTHVANSMRQVSPPDPVTLGDGDVDFSLMRYALGMPHLKPGTNKANDAPINRDDIQKSSIPATLASIIGGAGGDITIIDML